MPYFRKSAKNVFFPGKNPASSFKKVRILVQIPYGKSALFALEPREKPHANPDKPLANECGRRVHPNYDAPTLTTAGEARGNELLSKKVSLIFMKIYRNEV